MEEKKNRKVYMDCSFYVLDDATKNCLVHGYCPNCDPEMSGEAWHRLELTPYDYCCHRCGISIFLNNVPDDR